MWDDVERLSGLPPFRLSGCNDIDLQDKLRLTKSDLDNKLRQLEFTKVELSHAKANHAELVEVQLQLTDARNKVLALEDSNDELSRANSSLEAEVSHLSNEMGKLNQRLNSIEDELAEAESQVHRRQQIEKENNARIAAYAAADKRQKAELDETQQFLQESQTKNIQLTDDLQKVNQKTLEVLSVLKNREEEAESSRRELETIKGELEVTKQQLATMVQREKEADVQAKHAREEAKETMQFMSTKLENSCNEIRSEMNRSHKIEVDSINCDLKRITEENCRIMVKYEHCTVELRAAKESNSELSLKLQRSDSELEEERRQREMLQALHRSTKDENEQLRKELWAATEKLNSVKSRSDTAQKTSRAEKESLQRQLSDAKKMFDAGRQRHESSLKEMEDQFVSFVRDLFRSKR